MEGKFSMAEEPFEENSGANLSSAQRAAQFVKYANSNDFVTENSLEDLEKKLFGLVRHHNHD
jgi:hypothetical protein